jgi:diguanylate cyclase (GGDEF)-like protein/PAS domain S-box-containing protein
MKVATHADAAIPASPARRALSVRLALVAAGIGVAITALHLVWPTGSFGDITYLVVNCGAAVAALIGWRRGRDTVAAWIAVGVGLSAVGDLIYQGLIWIGQGTEETSPADLGWVGSYVALIAALLLLLRRARDWLDVDAWVDVAAVTLIALMVQWQIALVDIIADSSSPIHARIVWTIYPALDAVLMALVVRTTLARRLHGVTAAVLIGGAACWLVSDFLYTLAAPTGTVSAWLDSGWMLGAVLLAAAAWTPPVQLGAADEPSVVRLGTYQVSRIRIAIALMPLLIPGAIEMLGAVRGFDPNPVPLFLGAFGLVALAYLRFVRLSHASDDARALLRSQERRARVVAANASDASVVVDAYATILDDVPELAALVGRPELPTQGTNLFDLVQLEGVEDPLQQFRRFAELPGEVLETEVKLVDPHGEDRWIGARVVNLLDDPDIAGVLVNLHDITRRKQVEDELAYQAFHDALTGLANRSLFMDRVDHAIRRNARTGLDIAVVFLDLDGFKSVNDSLGHAAGDALLCEVAERLKAAVRSEDTVARLGGDEFAVLLEQTRGPIEEAVTVCERILATLSEPIVVEGQPKSVGASLGIAIGSPEATTASLLRDADVAMYRAKEGGRGRWVVHDSEMRTEAAERLQLETDLLGALDGGELRLMYQPVVELGSGEVISFEALLRWDHPTLGLIPPDRFIPIAEQSGLILPIGAWVLKEACRQASEWHRAHPEHRDLAIAVNVSARQVASPDLVPQVLRALAQSGLDPAKLALELTESTLVRDPHTAAARLHELRALGVKLAIDDFGTGYSSLSYLRQFPVDILKIDRSFVSTITEPGKVPAIVRGLLDLGRTLELTTVAEGVELALQADQLRDELCDFAQGYLFAGPLDAADAEALLDGQPALPATASA